MADDARRTATRLRKMAKRSERDGIDIGDTATLRTTVAEMTEFADNLTQGRDLHCHCGAAALDMVFSPPTGRTGMVGTLWALIHGDLIGTPVCLDHAQDSHVGYALCPCGARAGYVARLRPEEARRVARFDPELWVEYDEATYIVCAECAIASNSEFAAPHQDARPGPEQGEMLDTLLRRVRLMTSIGYGTSVAFHILETSIEGGFLRKAGQWLNLNAEDIVPLATEPTDRDLEFVREHIAANQPSEETFNRMEYLDRTIEFLRERRDQSATGAEVIEFPVDMAFAAD